GARGFFGKEITRELVGRGFRVRGVSRTPDTEDPNVHEWRAVDLCQPVPPATFAGAAVVVHAAADTTGGYDGHQRNTIDATRHVLQSMSAAGATRAVDMRRLWVLRPPGTPWGRPDERPEPAPPGVRHPVRSAWRIT